MQYSCINRKRQQEKDFHLSHFDVPLVLSVPLPWLSLSRQQKHKKRHKSCISDSHNLIFGVTCLHLAADLCTPALSCQWHNRKHTAQLQLKEMNKRLFHNQSYQQTTGACISNLPAQPTLCITIWCEQKDASSER